MFEQKVLARAGCQPATGRSEPTTPRVVVGGDAGVRWQIHFKEIHADYYEWMLVLTRACDKLLWNDETGDQQDERARTVPNGQVRDLLGPAP